MIALGGPKLKPSAPFAVVDGYGVSMIALGGPKLKLNLAVLNPVLYCFNDSTGWA